MQKKRIVIALGGNALGDNLAEQMAAAKITASAIVDLAEEGHEIAVVHGNGPQVGMINAAFDSAAKSSGFVQTLPMSVCVALSQGYIGYDLQNTIRAEIDRRRLNRQVATIITQVEVDPHDKAFENPSKPIGSFLSREDADKLKALNIPVMEDSGRGWRQVVASPKPVHIVEAETIKAILAAGQIPIAVGGGGIPVKAGPDGQYRGVSAVIDKDLSASLLAGLIGADIFIILTAVEKVAINFGKPEQKWLDTLTVAEAEKYINENQFGAGSMLPKIQAAIAFVKSGQACSSGDLRSPFALITLLTKAKEGIAGKTGTRIAG